MAQLKEDNEIKIFILYLLEKIGYPLTYGNISAIMMQDGLVNFFDFAECFYALVDAGHIREILPEVPEGAEEDPDAEPLFEVTATGRQVAEALSDNLMVSVREKSYRSALRHLSFAKQGAFIDHSYHPDPNGGYQVNCTIKSRDGVLLDLTVRADSEYQKNRMLDNFTDRPEVVLRGVVALLLGDVNYIFEDTRPR